MAAKIAAKKSAWRAFQNIHLWTKAYGFNHLLTWSNLLKLGLIKSKVYFPSFLYLLFYLYSLFSLSAFLRHFDSLVDSDTDPVKLKVVAG